jgi:sn-glycerol 3-phosphate transport system permease protein
MAHSSSAQPIGSFPRQFTPVVTAARRRALKKFFVAMLFLLPSLVIFLLFVFWPLWQNFWLSTYATDPLGRPSVFVGAEQYQRLLSNPDFPNSLTVSVSFALLTVPATIIVSLFLATLGNARLRGISIFRTAFSYTIAVSSATASLIFVYLFNVATGPLNYFLSLLRLPTIDWLTSIATALPSLALTTMWLQLGLNTIILLAGMQGISDEFYESAKIDGAAFWDSFRHITVPLLSPTMFFLIVVDTLGALQTFTQVQVMTKGGPVQSTDVLVYAIYRQFYFNGNYGYAAAQATILFLIMLILTTVQFGVIERRVFYQ